MARYTIGVTPRPDATLWGIGSSILGYDAATGLDAPFPGHPAYADPLSLIWSAEPRALGFCAVLKAPFALAEHATVEMLERDLAAFAAERVPIALDLTLSVVGRGLALVAATPDAALQSLADDCVRHFDPYRAPLSPEDRERRHPDMLIQRQVDNLDQWGDPYVLEDFQFHMALTGDLEPEQRHRLEPILQDVLAEAAPLRIAIDALTLMVQGEPEKRFTVQQRYPFAA